MCRMACKTGVVYLLNFRMCFKKPGDLESALILVSHPDRQSLQTTVKQKTGMRVK